MYIYIYIYIYIYMHTNIHTHTYIYIHTCKEWGQRVKVLSIPGVLLDKSSVSTPSLALSTTLCVCMYV